MIAAVPSNLTNARTPHERIFPISSDANAGS